MSIKREFTKDVIIYGVGSGIKKFIGLFLLPFYTRALTPADYGILDTLSTGIILISAFLNLGLDSAAGFYFFKTQEDQEKGKILFTKFILQASTVIPVSILIFFADDISGLLFGNDELSLVIIITTLIIPVNLLMSEQSHIYRYYRMPWKYNIITIVKSLTNIVFGISLVVVYKYGVLGAQLAALFSGLSVVIFSFIFFSRKIYNYHFSFSWAKRMIKFGFPLVWAGVAAWIYSSSDRFFLLHYQDLHEIGYYSIAATFSQPINMLNMAVQMSFGVLFYSIYYKDEDIKKKKSKQSLRDIFSLYIIVAVVISSFLSIFAGNIVPIIATKEYLPGILAIPFLAFSNIFLQAFQITSVGISLSEKTWYFTLIIICTALINVGLNFYFIPKFSFLGASITTIIACCFYWYSAYFISKNFFDIQVRILKVTLFIFSALIISATIPLSEILYKMEFGIFIKISLFVSCIVLGFIFGLIKTKSVKSIIYKFTSD